MARSVFYGFGAFVGALTGPTSCGFWPDDPTQFAWSHRRLINVDLGKNPEAVRRGLIKADEIEADDYAGYNAGGQTQIGPMWPGGRMMGYCWLESRFYEKLGKKKPPRIPDDFQAHAYELTSVLYWDGSLAGRRFNGVHAEIKQTKKVKSATMALAAIWAPGTSLMKGRPPQGVYWLDLGRDVHPIEDGFTQAGAGAKVPRTGALFVDARVLGAAQISLRKAPHAAGGVPTPTRRAR